MWPVKEMRTEVVMSIPHVVMFLWIRCVCVCVRVYCYLQHSKQCLWFWFWVIEKKINWIWSFFSLPEAGKSGKHLKKKCFIESNLNKGI